MYVTHFNALQTLLKSYSKGRRTFAVDWYNRQYERLEEVKTKGFPSVYVEFEQPIKWEKLTNSNQRAKVTIALHYCDKQLNDSPAKFLDDLNEFINYVDGKALKEQGIQLSDTLDLNATDVKEYSQLKVCVARFNTYIYRESGRKKTLVKVTPKMTVKSSP